MDNSKTKFAQLRSKMKIGALINGMMIAQGKDFTNHKLKRRFIVHNQSKWQRSGVCLSE